MKNKLNKDFWILSCIVSLAAIIGIVSNPTNQPPWSKFIIGMVLGFGLACLIISLIILIRSK